MEKLKNNELKCIGLRVTSQNTPFEQCKYLITLNKHILMSNLKSPQGFDTLTNITSFHFNYLTLPSIAIN